MLYRKVVTFTMYSGISDGTMTRAKVSLLENQDGVKPFPMSLLRGLHIFNSNLDALILGKQTSHKNYEVDVIEDTSASSLDTTQ